MDVADAPLRSRYGELSSDREGTRFLFLPPVELTLGSARLARDLCRKVGRSIRPFAPVTLRVGANKVAASFTPMASVELAAVVAAVDHCVDLFGRERIYPGVVDEVLGISPRERVRWIKDGRLPISGSGSFRRGQQEIRFPLHPLKRIAEIARQPELIANWRSLDARPVEPANPRSSQAHG